MNPVYLLGEDENGDPGTGRFYEGDQLMHRRRLREGEATRVTRKLDYVFYSAPRTIWPQTGASLRVLAETTSDHKLLIVSASFAP